MEFRSLHIAGFKTFADSVHVPIEEGLTGIIGPNGCGKSNLVEALLWVMGESSARRLRGQEMDDVVFNGSSRRPPRQVAEVSLTLGNVDLSRLLADNNDLSQLAAKIQRQQSGVEIEISRRLERGSGSQYRLNGKVVRARDVHMIFADAASGAQSASIISQGQIAALLQARPIERRYLLEEAAGIAGLRMRRSEALTRINQTIDNLEKTAGDVERTASLCDRLEAEAALANIYRDISQQIIDVNLSLDLARWQELHNKLERHKNLFHTADQEVQQGMLAEKAVTDGLKNAEEQWQQARENEKKQQTLSQTAEKLALQAKAKMEAEEKSRLDATRQLAQLEKEQQHLEQQQAAALVQENDAKEQLCQLHSQIEATQQELAAITASMQDEKSSVSQYVTETARQKSLYAVQQAEAKALQQQLASLQQRLQEMAHKKQRLAQQLNDILQATPAPETLEAEKALLQQAQEAVTMAVHRVEAAQTTIKTQEKEQQEKLQCCNSTEANYKGLQAEIKALQSAMAISLPTAEQRRELLANHMNSAQGYEKAVAAALGEGLDAGLSPSNLPWWHVANPTPLSTLAPILTSDNLWSKVEAPAQLQAFFSSIAVVENWQQALVAAENLPVGGMVASQDGGMAFWYGLRQPPGANQRGAVLLAQKNRRKQCEEEAALLAATLTEQQSQLQQATTALQQARIAGKQAEEECKQCQKNADSKHKALLALEQQAEIARKKGAYLLEENNLLAEEEQKLQQQWQEQQQKQALQPNLHASEQAINTALQQQQQAEIQLHASEKKHRDRSHYLQQLQQQAASLQERVRSLQQQHQQWQKNQSDLQQRRLDLQEILHRKSEMLDVSALIDSAREAAKLLQQHEQAAKLAEKQLDDMRCKMNNALALQSASREKRARQESAYIAVKEQQQQMVAELENRHQQPLSILLARHTAAQQDARLDNIKKLEESLQLAIQQRDALGPVNLLAEEELQKTRSEHEKLLHERADLSKALSRLQTGLETIENEAQSRFNEAFIKVAEGFSRNFSQLFQGGEAEIRLEEGKSWLEAGLEIYASPPGKKRQSLGLLSGGEQALTALALVFAVFLSQPSPICVLDEADAPLDEANVTRFCDMVEDIARQTGTRFMVITHHAYTMARMHRLVGVTMQEKGISTVITVDSNRFAAQKTFDFNAPPAMLQARSA
ncbi:MAG: chromosome segregation protein SMC [Alphaproteobacteria bacterium]